MAAVRILVSDVERAKAFYVEALGFEVVEQWGPAIAIIRRGDTDLWLSGPKTSAAKAWTDGTQPVPGLGFTRPVLDAGDLNVVLAKVVEAGGRVCNGPLKGPGGTQTIIADPDGNTIELFS